MAYSATFICNSNSNRLVIKHSSVEQFTLHQIGDLIEPLHNTVMIYHIKVIHVLACACVDSHATTYSYHSRAIFPPAGAIVLSVVSNNLIRRLCNDLMEVLSSRHILPKFSNSSCEGKIYHGIRTCV